MRKGLVAFFLFISCWTFSQTHVSVSKSLFEVGEQITLTYRLKYKKTNSAVHFSSFSSFIPCLNLSDSTISTYEVEIIKPFQDTLYEKNGYNIWEGSYLLTSWESGKFLLPPVSISLTDKLFHFESIALVAKNPIGLDKKEMNDIQEMYSEIPFSFTRWMTENSVWIIAVLVVFVGIILFYIFKSKEKQVEEVPISIKQQALDAIHELSHLRRTNQAELKIYFDRLSVVLKRYLSSRYELEFMERTSYQTSSLLIQCNVDSTTVKNIQLVLEQADLVKFANSEVDEINVTYITAVAIKIVNDTSPKFILYV